MICLIIPCYKTSEQLPEVIKKIGSEVDKIILVDDACPENTAETAMKSCQDQRIVIVPHKTNQGVGGAVVSGIRKALELKAEIIVRIDSDGQMDPQLIPKFIYPIQQHSADFTKGNRFWNLETLKSMPAIRLLGNAALSFFGKLSTGYWSIMDPNNGFFAMHATMAQKLDLDKLDKRYFFESDLLFRLNTIRAKVIDIPMRSTYQGEPSSLVPLKCILDFFAKHCRNFFKRIFYNYFLRDFNITSISLLLGFALTSWGVIFGAMRWFISTQSQVVATSGTVMLAALPIIVGFQLLLAALQQDIASEPKTVQHTLHQNHHDFL